MTEQGRFWRSAHADALVRVQNRAEAQEKPKKFPSGSFDVE
jgi:hypothetical protein